MKRISLLYFLLAAGSIVLAQAERKCGFDYVQQHISQHPDFNTYQINKQLAYKNVRHQKADTVIRIPVVVHVIHRLAAENISTAQINSQIAVLNRDFRKLNADTTNAAGWSIADVKFEFVLATKDPSGNPSTGITRTATTIDNICDNSNQYATLRPAWNPERYLNIWVCDVGDFILGFAYPPNAPGISPAEDGVVIGHNYFGTVGSVQAPWNLGRTTTHEIGHYFDLLHLWGNDNNPSCNTDDGIADTPNQADEEYNCATRTSCGSLDQLSNFLQYVDDACMGNFTVGQKNRMRMALYTQRDSLQFGDLLNLTSISEQNLFSKTLLYPNPNHGLFQIELTNVGGLNRFEIEVYNMAGKLVAVETKTNQSGLLINMETAANGVYFVRIINGEFSSTKKLIKH